MQGGPSPLPQLVEIARQLEKAGADLIAVPCNTAHYWYDQLTEAVDTPIINIIEATVAQLRRLAGKELVGLLATDGTLSSKLYQGVLEEHSIPFITPNCDDQKHVMEVVYSIKEHGVTAELRTKIRKVAENLVDAGARAVITGCTELPLALDPSYDTLEVPVADSLTALAEMVLDLMRPNWRDKRSARKGKK
jgi:aspartate racemase